MPGPPRCWPDHGVSSAPSSHCAVWVEAQGGGNTKMRKGVEEEWSKRRGGGQCAGVEQSETGC